MLPIRDLFETHLTVSNLNRSVEFYSDIVGLELAHRIPEAVFFWIGGRGHAMLGLWAAGPSPQRMSLHFAFKSDLADLLEAPRRLRELGVTPLDFWGQASDQVSVLGWMPAAAVYFHDPDQNLLEFIAMLPDAPRPEAGVVTWRQWNEA